MLVLELEIFRALDKVSSTRCEICRLYLVLHMESCTVCCMTPTGVMLAPCRLTQPLVYFVDDGSLGQQRFDI